MTDTIVNRPIAVLIACVSKKQAKPCQAINLYISDLFKKSVCYANQFGLPIYILSAKYGLIKGSRVIAPYNLTLNNMKKSELEKWAINVARSVKEEFDDRALLVLAGEKYLSFTRYTDNKIINPLKKLSIGKRLQYLKAHRRSIVSTPSGNFK